MVEFEDERASMTEKGRRDVYGTQEKSKLERRETGKERKKSGVK